MDDLDRVTVIRKKPLENIAMKVPRATSKLMILVGIGAMLFAAVPTHTLMELAKDTALLVTGVLIHAFGHDPATKFVNRHRRRYRVRQLTKLRSRHPDTVRLGKEQTFTCVIDGDGVSAIPPTNIECSLDSTELAVPLELVEAVQSVAQREQERKMAALPHAWNGKMAHIRRFNVSREPDSEAPRITFNLQVAQYFHFVATNVPIYNEFVEAGFSSPTRRRLIGTFSNWRNEVPANIVNGLPLNLFVLTSDNKLIFSERSENVAIAPGAISAAINENLHPDDDHHGRGNRLEMAGLIKRAMQQEIGWDDDKHGESPLDPKAEVNLLGFAVHTGHVSYSLFGYARLNATYSVIQELFAFRCKDRFETRHLIPVPFDVDRVCGFIHHHRLYDTIGMAATYVLIHSGMSVPAIEHYFLQLQNAKA